MVPAEQLEMSDIAGVPGDSMYVLSDIDDEGVWA